MNLITSSLPIRTAINSIRQHHNNKEINITLLTNKLFKGDNLNQKYIEETINECLSRQQPFVSTTPYNADDHLIIEEAILLAKANSTNSPYSYKIGQTKKITVIPSTSSDIEDQPIEQAIYNAWKANKLIE